MNLVKLPVDSDYPTHSQRHRLRQQYINEMKQQLNQYLEHEMIAITVKPLFSTSDFWTRTTADNAAYVRDCYLGVERQLNSIIVKNHRRPSKQHLLLKSHQFVEITKKDSTIECPHSHGILMVHPDTALKFESLLTNPTLDENTGVLSYHLKHSLLQNLSNQIHSIKLHRLHDVTGWIDYCTKQIERIGYPNAFTTGFDNGIKQAA
jgi:hypothetical protein